MTRRLRWAFALIALLFPALAIGATGLLWRDSLPNRIASHWPDLGTADDSLPTLGVFAFSLALALLATIIGAVIVAHPRLSGRAKRAALFWSGLPAGLAAAIWLVPAWLTLQAGSADQAVLGPWIIPLLLCSLYGAVPYAIAPPMPGTQSGPTPALPLRASETAAWSRTVTANVFVYITLAVAVLAMVVAVSFALSGGPASAGIGLAILLVADIALASFIRLRITVDRRGLRIVSLLLRIPLKHIPLDRIRHAEATDLHPGEWGGWGYRIMPGRSALILRAGPGIVVRTTDDKQFAVSLTDPETPASLLNALHGRDSAGSFSSG